MRMYDIIIKKRNGEELTKEEIQYFVKGYTEGSIPDYQAAALLMSIYFKGMNKKETAELTIAMVNSGDAVDLSEINGIKVDKHSTGGVGDKISLIVVPLVASLGIPVAKMSGRGLGHTGGTIDKLEAIDGFKTEYTKDEFINNVNKYKMAISGQSGNLVPADKKLYALRDVTATIDSIPLIASSVMSKKIASGADCIVLDVKVGSGAFMKSVEEAVELAETMVEIGKSLKRRTVAIVTDMNQPLGHEVGNSNEIIEAIDVLKGKGSEDETEVALTIAAYMAILGGAYEEFEEAYSALREIIESGKAIDKLKHLIKIQGGDPEIVDNTDRLPRAKYHIEVKSEYEGFITSINAENIGISAMLLGAGRKTKEDKIDFSAGISLKKKVGDRTAIGETLCILHTNLGDTAEAEQIAQCAYNIGNIQKKIDRYVYRIIQ
ncbi:MAG TPA: pyrimidine-nucleoside phosphorylase [Bacillota bacterium]|nr:pyrimidine-nucleoside phosphorylase [Bacillota bacterium]HOR86760.1 pyrimidine-nucleoside phosphorylase [Bacillota bacterium]HPL54073.1 pyrimidine-nucleoside phosphorylase [Bacillota bacterium]